MSEQLRKDLEYVLPKLKLEERVDERKVLEALEALLPERKGAYTQGEVRAHLKDDYYFQRARIQSLAGEVSPGCIVEFDEAVPFIKFRIKGHQRISAEQDPSIWADKSDEWMRRYIRQLLQ